MTLPIHDSFIMRQGYAGDLEEAMRRAFYDEFQDFIDGPDGVNFGLVALNNNVMQLNLELTGGQTPYERKF